MSNIPNEADAPNGAHLFPTIERLESLHSPNTKGVRIIHTPKVWNESFKSVYRLVADFLKYHFCNNIECGGFSFKKCSKCNHAHYCNGNCQRRGFTTHKAECKSRKSWEGYKAEVPWILKNYVDEGLHDETDDDVVTMEVFLRELMMKAYSSFHETLAVGERSLHATMIYVLIKSKRYVSCSVIF